MIISVKSLVGNYLGMTYDGKTFNQAGEIVAHSDILSSLLVREEKVMAMKKKDSDIIGDKVHLESTIKGKRGQEEEYTKRFDPEYFSLGVGDIYEEEEEEKKEPYYVRKFIKERMYGIGDIVETPYGRGRVVRVPTEFGDIYTVRMTKTDEPEIVEEKDIKKIGSSFEEKVRTLSEEAKQSYETEREIVDYVVHKLKEESADKGVFIEPDTYSIETIIKQHSGCRKGSELQDIGFHVDITMEVWVDAFDIKHDDAIETIKKQNISLEEKITLGKDRTKELAQEQLNEFDRQAGKFGINIKEISVGDLKLDRINWAEIFESEEIEGSKKQADDNREFDVERRTYYGEEENAPPVIEEKLGRFTLNNIEKKFPSFTEDELTRIDELDLDQYTHTGSEGEATPEKPSHLYTIHRVNSKIARITGWEPRPRRKKKEGAMTRLRFKLSDIYRPDVTRTEWYELGKRDRIESPKLLLNYPKRDLFDSEIEYQHAVDIYWKGYGLPKKPEVVSMREAVNVGWLRDEWLKSIDKIMDALEEVRGSFKNERKDKTGPGVALFDYYNLSRYEEIERPLRDKAITKTQAKKLLEDLVYQFRMELFSTYDVRDMDVKELEKEEGFEIKEEDTEKVSVSIEDVGYAFGDTNIYPYKGTGGGMPSSSELTRMTEEIPTREVRAL